jgi:hypothetical protein
MWAKKIVLFWIEHRHQMQMQMQMQVQMQMQMQMKVKVEVTEVLQSQAEHRTNTRQVERVPIVESSKTIGN